jgi:hypothetical protein
MPDNTTVAIKNLPVACDLPDDALAERLGEIEEDIWTSVQERRELPDGYEFRFPATDEWAERLAHFIRFERRCCRFLLFELVFEQDEGPIWLRLRGRSGTKEFIESM